MRRVERVRGGVNYRPDDTPTKVGMWILLVQDRCLVYLPDNKFSYDEGTAKYSGRMSLLKHKQPRFKPYDGIRVYMLNDSTTGICLEILFDMLHIT